MGEGSREEAKKDKKTVLREEELKEGKKERPVEVRKVEEGKLLREVTVKIELKQKDDKERIIVKVLLDSKVIILVISSEFAKKNEFRKKKLNKPIYIRNVNGIFNYERPIEHIVEVELFYRGHKKRMKIDVIGGQK